MIWTAAQAAFRDEVRSFVAGQLSPETRRKVRAGHPLDRADYMDWQDKLAAKGWLAGFWPVEHGGLGWSAAETFIFHDELSYAGAPWLLPFGVNYVGPVIFSFGSEAQKQAHLPGILDNSVFWCQGYSEPNAGSDLANLRTRAVRDGDAYIVNGSKIWTTMAHWADKIFCLVRTDTEVKPQRGISFLLIDLNSPGVEIRPIDSIDGFHHLNQVFFTDVRVPVENLVGEENKGWTYAKYLLGHERVLSAETGKARRLLERAEATAELRGRRGDQRLKDRIAGFGIDLMALEAMTLRLLEKMLAGDAPGVEASLLKVRGSVLLQEITEFTVDIFGAAALAYDPDTLGQGNRGWPDPAGAVADFLYNRAPTIWGGSNEIQRNIIAKMELGL